MPSPPKKVPIDGSDENHVVTIVAGTVAGIDGFIQAVQSTALPARRHSMPMC